MFFLKHSQPTSAVCYYDIHFLLILRYLHCVGFLRFVQQKFEEIFHKHARTHPNALTSDELSEMLKANREPKDYAGWYVSHLRTSTVIIS